MLPSGFCKSFRVILSDTVLETWDKDKGPAFNPGPPDKWRCFELPYFNRGLKNRMDNTLL